MIKEIETKPTPALAFQWDGTRDQARELANWVWSWVPDKRIVEDHVIEFREGYLPHGIATQLYLNVPKLWGHQVLKGYWVVLTDVKDVQFHIYNEADFEKTYREPTNTAFV